MRSHSPKKPQTSTTPPPQTHQFAPPTVIQAKADPETAELPQWNPGKRATLPNLGQNPGGTPAIQTKLTPNTQQQNSLQPHTQPIIQRVTTQPKQADPYAQEINANKAEFKKTYGEISTKMNKAGLSISDLETFAVKEYSRENFDFMNAYKAILDAFNGKNADDLVLPILGIHLRYVEDGAPSEANFSGENRKKCVEIYENILTGNKVPDPAKLPAYIAALGTYAWKDVGVNLTDTVSRVIMSKKTGLAGFGQSLKKGVYNAPEYVKEGKSNVDNYVTSAKNEKAAIKEEVERQDTLETLGRDPRQKRKRHGQTSNMVGTSRRRR
ncbi:hypothetical protein PN441_18260 [Spirulina major CS-329]|uniref:hypothetical protein n=1 Tax=Spirulina TaxID=1154 RepID=UPI00232BEAB3|nr:MULTISPECIES: hypothetical protein [Spirulina]MDB9496607.1 hypothetical protein [Spirulina subsalsa CS-330]MDB9505026.1 hypothetical protein [Spirulina major CS-329]